MAAKRKDKEQKRRSKAQRRQRELHRTQEAAKETPSPAPSPEPRQVAPTEPPKEMPGSAIPKDPEVAIAAFKEALEAGTLDADEVFEWLNSIRDGLGGEDPEARARFAALVEELRQKAPELYQNNIPYFTDNLTGDAIAEGRWEAIPDLLAPFVEEPDRHADLFFKLIDQLLYHGQMRVLRDAMRRAWPAVQRSGELLPWAIEEFGAQAMLVELFDYLQTTAQPRADDPALLEATAPYGQWTEGWLEQAIPHLTAPASSPWQPADFGETVDADQWGKNLWTLLLEFVADRHRAGVPLSRGYMARTQLGEFLSWQLSNPTLSEDRPEKKKGGRLAKQLDGSSLVPRRAPLDRFLVKLFPFLGAQPYKAAALMELLPAYLHFLARINLIHPTEMDQALEELRPLSQHVPGILRNYGADPVAVQVVAAAWAGEALAALRDDPALVSARATPPQELTAPSLAPAPRPGA